MSFLYLPAACAAPPHKADAAQDQRMPEGRCKEEAAETRYAYFYAETTGTISMAMRPFSSCGAEIYRIHIASLAARFR